MPWVVLAAGLAVLAAGATPASASLGTTPYPTVSQLQSYLEDPPPGVWAEIEAGLNGATTSVRTAESGIVLKTGFATVGGDGHSIADEYFRIRRSTGILPQPGAATTGLGTGLNTGRLLARVGTVGVLVGAFGFGWKIGRAVDTKWLHFSGDAGHFSGAMSSEQWKYYTAGTDTHGGATPNAHWTYEYNTGGGMRQALSACNTLSCAGFDGDQLAAYQASWPVAGTAGTLTLGTLVVVGAAGSFPQYVRTMTPEQMEARFHPDGAMEPWTSQAFSVSDTCGSCGDLTGTPSVVPSAVSAVATAAPAAQAAMAHTWVTIPEPGFIQAPSPTYPGGVEDPWNPDAQPTPEPAGEPAFEEQPATFTMPQLQPLETYDHYLARLRTLGWVGTAVIYGIPESSVDTTLNPKTVMAQPVPAPGTTAVPTTVTPTIWINEPQPEPSPGDCPDCTGDPTTEPPEPEGGFGIPTPPPDSGDDCCPTNSVDLSPLSIECADKFPCGLFAYAAAFLGNFDVTPQAPVFDLAVAGVGPHYVVDLGSVTGLNDYMALIRTVLSVCLWAGAVWWLASRLLKFDATGDPGAAVDEGMPW